MLRLSATLVLLGGMVDASSHPPCHDPSCTKEPPDSKVFQLNPDNFHRFVKKNPITLMEFYAPWCGHCQNLGPHYRAAAAALADMDLPEPVVLAKVDDGNEDNRNRLRAGAPDMYNYTSYPTLLLFRGDPEPSAKCPWDPDCPPTKDGCPHPGDRKGLNCWEYYGGGREEEDITFYMSTVAKGLNPFNEEAKLKPGLYKDAHGPIKELDPDNFDEVIMDTSPENNKIWILEFYSDRCPICKGLVPEIKKAAETTMKEFPGVIAFGGVNSRVYHEIAEKHGITSYPWVTSFYKGKKIEDMAGLGGWETVYNWAKKKHAENWKPDSNQVFGCKTLEKAALDASKVTVGSAVTVVSDESVVSKCIAEKGKTWEGKMKDKRGKYLGQSGKVVEVDTKKDALLIEFASDNTQMWWGALYLNAADGKEL